MKATLERDDLDAFREIVREEVAKSVQPRLLNLRQAAAYMGRPGKEDSFRQFAKRVGIPTSTPDTCLLFDRLVLDSYIDKWTAENGGVV